MLTSNRPCLLACRPHAFQVAYSITLHGELATHLLLECVLHGCVLHGCVHVAATVHSVSS